MFTGLVKTTAEVVKNDSEEFGARLVVSPKSRIDVEIGDSVCVNGACLTVVDFDESNISFDVVRETLDKTSLGDLTKGKTANLEPSLALSDLVGGHLVTGHVDFVSELLEFDGEDFWFSILDGYHKYIAQKGSICVNGVSLTVAQVEKDRFKACLIPETLAKTNLSLLKKGSKVNVEVDLIARYLEKLI